jgi:Ser/Thr protein kinase RdoA (MazF antagonist)
MNANIRITELLARYGPALRPQGQVESLGNAGGLSGAQLWRYRSSQGPLCLRAWPTNSRGRAHLELIHRWLAKARCLDFIPVPIPDQRGQTLQSWSGTFWDLTRWMPGLAVLQNPSVPQVESAFTALAQFHNVLGDERTTALSPGLRTRLDDALSLKQGGLEKLRIAIETTSSSKPGIQEAAKYWLSLARPALPQLVNRLSQGAPRPLPLQPCLRDARPDHFLLTVDRVTGLVDFGSMDIESTTADLARLMGDWLPKVGDLRSAALAAYNRIRPLAPAEFEALPLFESSADLLIGERLILWNFIEHRAFPNPTAVIEGIQRSIHRLEQ